MPLSWNEIKQRAISFSKEWAGETREDAEAKSFWDGFFNVFGIKRRLVATFEEPVKNLKGSYGYIDLFWKKTLLAEHKSEGKDLGKANSQACQYIQDLANAGRQNEIPRYVIVSDFAKIALHDLEPDPGDNPVVEFKLADFHKNIHYFGFIPGYKQHKYAEQDPINFKAVEILGDLHDALAEGGYSGHELERFLVRILFCLFAEDTGLFERESFSLYIENRTNVDGSDLGLHLAKLFAVLNCPQDKRQKNLDETLAAFPYVNGDLYGEQLGFADFDAGMRAALLRCTVFDWSRISPAIFGSLFQAVMDAKERRQVGGHYTSERDILKVVKSLFLDDLWEEFAGIQADKSQRKKSRLSEFQAKLASLRFFDPACGCGNFLVITYRELRKLELAVLRAIHDTVHTQQEMTLDDVNRLAQVDVDQMYGIEIQEWPARIAEVALWLMDHLMNLEVSEAFGQLYQRLPLKKSPTIVCGNSLLIDWKTVIAPGKCAFILGNPPFVGKHYQSSEQRADLVRVFRDFKNTGDIDYVAAWYYLAAEYVHGTKIKVGFVSTNSICQGEQVPILWGVLFERFKIKIHFAHRTFKWESEARGKAHVHVIIVGFGNFDTTNKRIYDYENDAVSFASYPNISPYLTPGSDVFITKRQTPLCAIPEMRCGNKPTDGGNFILTDAEKDAFLLEEPKAAKFLRRYTGSEEFINGNMRWCLWLKDADPSELRALPKVLERVERVKAFREKSTAAPTRKSANQPTLFFYVSQPATEYILIPEVSSERRKYIPIGFMPKEIISANTNFIVESNSLFLFGVLTSEMHMIWMRQVGGRLKSDYRYSGSMVYNNFPWPQNVHDKQRKNVEALAQGVLDARKKFPKSTLADLYDPLTMPPELHSAHTILDRAVEKCYRPEPFDSDRKRIEFLFTLYELLNTPLLPPPGKRKKD